MFVLKLSGIQKILKNISLLGAIKKTVDFNQKY